jgi:hypothetical protein
VLNERWMRKRRKREEEEGGRGTGKMVSGGGTLVVRDGGWRSALHVCVCVCVCVYVCVCARLRVYTMRVYISGVETIVQTVARTM